MVVEAAWKFFGAYLIEHFHLQPKHALMLKQKLDEDLLVRLSLSDKSSVAQARKLASFDSFSIFRRQIPTYPS